MVKKRYIEINNKMYDLITNKYKDDIEKVEYTKDDYIKLLDTISKKNMIKYNTYNKFYQNNDKINELTKK